MIYLAGNGGDTSGIFRLLDVSKLQRRVLRRKDLNHLAFETDSTGSSYVRTLNSNSKEASLLTRQDTRDSGADTMSIASSSVNTISTFSIGSTSSRLSRVESTSSSGSRRQDYTFVDLEAAKDAISVPAGREIMVSKHRKLHTGRGGAGNAYKLLVDDHLYRWLLLHEQSIVQAYVAERKARKDKEEELSFGKDDEE